MDGSTSIVTNTKTVVGDIMDGVRQSAMLADVTISMWNAERTDKARRRKLEQDEGVIVVPGSKATTVKKNMLYGADKELEDARSAFTSIRTLHYSMTLPWVSNPQAQRQDGARLLPIMIHDDYLTAIATRRYQATVKLDEFVAVYPQRVQEAVRNLGGLGDSIYPTADAVKVLFNARVDLEPIPNGAQFQGLPEETIERYALRLEQKQKIMLGEAQRTMWERVHNRVGHLADVLANPDSRFHETTVGHVRDLVGCLPGWNLTGDQRVDETVAGIKNLLADFDLKEVKKSDAARKQAAQQAQTVVDKLKAWGL